jgi:hypothetical protein
LSQDNKETSVELMRQWMKTTAVDLTRNDGQTFKECCTSGGLDGREDN